MKYRFLIPMYLAAFLLQTSFFSALPIGGVTANLLLILGLLIPVYYEGKQAPVFGFLFGLLEDICFGLVIGPSCILYALLSFIVCLLRRFFYAEKIYTVPLLLLPGTCLYQVLYWVFLKLMGRSFDFMIMAEDLPLRMGLELFAGFILFFILEKNREKLEQERDLFKEKVHG